LNLWRKRQPIYPGVRGLGRVLAGHKTLLSQV
jgi:hypothetical protein